MKKLFLSVALSAGVMICSEAGAVTSELPQVKKCEEAMKQAMYEVAVQQCEYEAEKGSTEAAEYLGYMYLKGKGVARDWGLARKYLEQAVDGGLVTARRYLAILYWNGLGVERSREKAMELFNDCMSYEMQNGGDSCKVQLAQTLSFGTNSEQDHRYAKDLYAQLFEKKDYQYSLDLAKMYLVLGQNAEAYKYAEFYIWWAKRYGDVEQLRLSMSDATVVKNKAVVNLSDVQVNDAYNWVKNEIYKINEEHMQKKSGENVSKADVKKQ